MIPDRVLQDTTATITVTFRDVDGDPVDPSPATATIELLNDAGTVLVAAGTATTRASAGVFTYPLTTTHTAELDRLEARWTSSLGTLTTRVEIVGGFLFTVADARADDDITDNGYTTDEIQQARTYAEQELEKACGVAFVPRYRRDTIAPGCGAELTIRPRLREVRAISRGATSITTGALTWDAAGTVRLGNTLPIPATGTTNVDVAYEHGMDEPPAAVSQAALMLAKDYLVRGAVDDRAIQRATEDGPIFIATPGFQGQRFGIPSVDAVVDVYQYRPTYGSIPITR